MVRRRCCGTLRSGGHTGKCTTRARVATQGHSACSSSERPTPTVCRAAWRSEPARGWGYAGVVDARVKGERARLAPSGIPPCVRPSVGHPSRSQTLNAGVRVGAHSGTGCLTGTPGAHSSVCTCAGSHHHHQGSETEAGGTAYDPSSRRTRAACGACGRAVRQTHVAARRTSPPARAATSSALTSPSRTAVPLLDASAARVTRRDGGRRHVQRFHPAHGVPAAPGHASLRALVRQLQPQPSLPPPAHARWPLYTFPAVIRTAVTCGGVGFPTAKLPLSWLTRQRRTPPTCLATARTICPLLLPPGSTLRLLGRRGRLG